MTTIRIRCHQNDFQTDIPVSEWEAHDALFQAGWDVLTLGYRPTAATPPAPVEPTSQPAPEITVGEYVDRYLAGEGRGDSEEDRLLEQFAANHASDIEAEFARRNAAAGEPHEAE